MCQLWVLICNNTTSSRSIFVICLFIAEALVGQDIAVNIVIGSWLGMGAPAENFTSVGIFQTSNLACDGSVERETNRNRNPGYPFPFVRMCFGLPIRFLTFRVDECSTTPVLVLVPLAMLLFLISDDQSDQATGPPVPAWCLLLYYPHTASAMPWRCLAGKNDATAVYFFAP